MDTATYALPDSDEERMARQMDDAQAQAHADALASGRRQQIPRPGPALQPADRPRVLRLKEGLFRETRGMGRNAAFPCDEFRDEGVILARYRIFSRENLRRAQNGPSHHVCARPTRSRKTPLPGLHLMRQILGNPPPRQLQIRPNSKYTDYGAS